jgi:tRNA dimethylallyltransferase
MQVYKGLDIGSAKPDSAYVNRLPHHLISIKEPHQQFSAGDFVVEAERLIPEIYNRDKIPVLSGGTAFYFRNFLFGLPDIPEIDKHFREELNEELAAEGLEKLYNELCICDPSSGHRLNCNDSSRIIRALEVYRATGNPLSTFKLSTRIRDDYPIKMIGLERDREELYSRINRRVDIMFAQGLIDEIQRLIKEGIRNDSPARKREN